jgi:hypothetical protein
LSRAILYSIAAILFLSDISNATIIFSGVWTIIYLFAIRRLLSQPVDDFAAQRISYAQPNLHWINFVKSLGKNNTRFIFVSLLHLIMALLPILIFRNILNNPLIIFAILISNAALPISYLFLLKRLYSFWRDNKAKIIDINNG